MGQRLSDRAIGIRCLLLGVAIFSGSFYTLIYTKFFPPGNVFGKFWRDDFHYSYLFSAITVSLTIFVMGNWFGLKLFRSN